MHPRSRYLSGPNVTAFFGEPGLQRTAHMDQARPNAQPTWGFAEDLRAPRPTRP
ncbi:hypothetical protein SLNWT_2968 [Streptomyces albus]|uniref:Uncharacterized protein n=1 Tax=Streptomyces albus (strain ATCC 21838 / DSM 41398 / FERM P-419 / JCM 4703 / NBRC 107858) TaxID=1081613 RepID=A0A0B5EP68_STRA4|nr:hypothetical protein SLNWT_2968 [Streptomyces albus]